MAGGHVLWERKSRGLPGRRQSLRRENPPKPIGGTSTGRGVGWLWSIGPVISPTPGLGVSLWVGITVEGIMLRCPLMPCSSHAPPFLQCALGITGEGIMPARPLTPPPPTVLPFCSVGITGEGHHARRPLTPPLPRPLPFCRLRAAAAAGVFRGLSRVCWVCWWRPCPSFPVGLLSPSHKIHRWPCTQGMRLHGAVRFQKWLPHPRKGMWGLK